MQKLRGLAVLMGITILGLTGFQLYWLMQNYSREKKTLGIKTDVSFRETIRDLQASKFNLGVPFPDSFHEGQVKVLRTRDGQATFRFSPGREQMISTINVMGDKLRDSLGIPDNRGVVISMNKDLIRSTEDTGTFETAFPGKPGSENRFINLLYGVDTLQDSLKIKEIDLAYRKSLDEQRLNIPFTILRLDSVGRRFPRPNHVTVGFARPITYQLQLGNTVPYLLKRIAAPILFSVLLMGITILSFVLLYRNLLRQRRLAALKNEFISNITHELKTPIATVGVAIEALRNFNAMHDAERTREYLDISSNELQRLDLLVDKVLKLSMFEKQAVDLRYEDLNLKDIIDEVTGSLRLQLEKKKASLTVTSEGNLGMQGDKLHLQSVVFNLLDNAIKYSDVEPVINIHLKELEDSIQLNVSDNGIGIAEEYKDRIFEKFFRIPHGDTHNARGYGLGLSYVAHVVEKHRGKIQLESSPGRGSSFTITLPKEKV
jgi:two-component system, OmpR family, phosphate regulon sensor histidine kinase PhoR